VEGIQEWDASPYHEIAFDVSRSRRYHIKMRAFFEGLHAVIVGANALLAASAFWALLGGKDGAIAQWLTAAIALLAVLDVVFTPAKKGALHADLARRFTMIATGMVTRPPTPDNLMWAREERLKIEQDEPPEKRLVDLLAQNDEFGARGLPNETWQLNWWQRHLGYVMTFGMKRLEKVRDERAAQRASDPTAVERTRSNEAGPSPQV
jgi:hypothetical protein